MGYLTLYTSDPVTELPSRHDDDDPVRNKVPQARSGDDLTACVFFPSTVIAFQLMQSLSSQCVWRRAVPRRQGKRLAPVYYCRCACSSPCLLWVLPGEGGSVSRGQKGWQTLQVCLVLRGWSSYDAHGSSTVDRTCVPRSVCAKRVLPPLVLLRVTLPSAGL